jgi:hypothetical protein
MKKKQILVILVSWEKKKSIQRISRCNRSHKTMQQIKYCVPVSLLGLPLELSCGFGGSRLFVLPIDTDDEDPLKSSAISRTAGELVKVIQLYAELSGHCCRRRESEAVHEQTA